MKASGFEVLNKHREKAEYPQFIILKHMLTFIAKPITTEITIIILQSGLSSWGNETKIL
jgi:hypothetical protein